MWRGTFVLLAGVMIACGGGGSKPEAVAPPDTASGPGAGGLLACQAVARAIDALVACARTEDEKLVVDQLFERQRQVATASQPFSDDRARTPTARMCLGFLEPLQDQLAVDKCTYTPTAQELAWLDAERRRRTPVPAEAKGADRDVLVRMAGLRDRACACKTQACYDELSRELDMGVGSLGPDASPALRDAGSEMIDELMGCGRRLALDAMPATPSWPADPAETKRLADQIRAERAAAARDGAAAADEEGGFEDEGEGDEDEAGEAE